MRISTRSENPLVLEFEFDEEETVIMKYPTDKNDPLDWHLRNSVKDSPGMKLYGRILSRIIIELQER